MAHPRLILRAATRDRSGSSALPGQDLTFPALDWVDDGMAPAVVDPRDVLPWLTHDVRVAGLEGRLTFDDPRPVFSDFFALVIEGGGTAALRAHLLAITDARRLASEAARVRDAVAAARHRPARPGEPLYEPFSSRRYGSASELLEASFDPDDPAPFAFAIRTAPWPGLTASEVEDHWREGGPADAASLLEASLPPSGSRDGDVRHVRALASFLDRAGGRARTDRFLASWNARQEVSGPVPDPTRVLWLRDGVDRESCEAWCRRRVSLHGGAIAALMGAWPPARRD